MAPTDQAAVVCLATELGEWFNADGLREIATDLRYQPGFVAEMNGQIIGFVVISVYEAKGRISWLGVQRGHQRMGIGRRLVGAVVSRMAGDGIKEVFVDTLGDSVEYEPYAKTRAFYRALGFTEHQRIMQPGNESMPERLVLVLGIGGSS
jgi:ribosomal protein S18 acetylase RimI-like enzyme